MPYIHGKSIIRIAVADDHEMFRELVSGFIDTIENCKVVIQAANGRDLLEKLEHKPGTDLVLLDIAMPEMDGYEAAKNIRLNFPDIKILFCSIFKTELAVCRMIGSGGHGYVEKGASSNDLKRAFFEIMKNGCSFPHTGSKIFFYNNRNGHKSVPKTYHLSEKELRFMSLICSEKTYKQIADELNLTERQIDYLREGLFSRFDVHSRIGLAFYAFQSGIPDSEACLKMA